MTRTYLQRPGNRTVLGAAADGTVRRLEASEFLRWWRAELGGGPPIGYHLRNAVPRRWVRFHSLPDGKRYATTPEETAEVLRRHNGVASELFSESDPLVFLCTGYSDSEQPVPPDQHHLLPPWLQLAHAATMTIDDPARYWHFWIAPTTWEPGRFDEILGRVACDEIRNVLLVQQERRAIYHPYDGGADVIGADMFVIDSLRRDFRQWLPPRADGW